MQDSKTCQCTGSKARRLAPPTAVSSGEYGTFDSTDPGVLIPLMQATQEEFGYLPRVEVARIADYLGLSEARVYGVATFYNQFRLEPLGKHYIQICSGTACHVKGASEIFAVIRAELGLEDSSTTKDGLFTIDSVACLGACSMAPLVNVNDEFHGHMTAQKALKLIRDIRAKERKGE